MTDEPPRPVTFDELRLEALEQAEYHDIIRADLVRRGEHKAAAARQRKVDIYERFRVLAERCADPVILRRLAELAAEAKAKAEDDESSRESDGDAS